MFLVQDKCTLNWVVDISYTVKPVLKSHPREDKNGLLKTGDLLIQVHLHCMDPDKVAA